MKKIKRLILKFGAGTITFGAAKKPQRVFVTEIGTPRGAIVKVGKKGTAKIVWNKNYVKKWAGRYVLAQKFLDSEVLRHCEPFTPLRTGVLIKSGILGTEIGSGTVQWIAPYAHEQYHGGRSPGQSKTGPLRGWMWFERMWEVWGKKIIEGTKEMMKRGQ